MKVGRGQSPAWGGLEMVSALGTYRSGEVGCPEKDVVVCRLHGDSVEVGRLEDVSELLWRMSGKSGEKGGERELERESFAERGVGEDGL